VLVIRYLFSVNGQFKTTKKVKNINANIISRYFLNLYFEIQSYFKIYNKLKMKRFKIYQTVSALRELILTKLVGLLNPMYKLMMPRNKSWQLTKADLRQFPDGSLGKNLAEFLDKNQFDILPFLETHDVYHVLLGYKPTIVDEARLYFWLLGNGKRSLEVFSTVMSGFIFLPDYWSVLIQDYRTGKTCRDISNWDFQGLMTKDLELLRGIVFRRNEQNYSFTNI
jgi:ubiquinone biosynthesis protein Coq4